MHGSFGGSEILPESRVMSSFPELCQVFFGTILAGSDFQAMRIELCQVFFKSALISGVFGLSRVMSSFFQSYVKFFEGLRACGN